MEPTKKAIVWTPNNDDGVKEFAQELVRLGYRVFSWGETAKVLSLAIPLTVLNNSNRENLLVEVSYVNPDLVCVELPDFGNAKDYPRMNYNDIVEMVEPAILYIVISAAVSGKMIACEKTQRKTVLEWIKGGEPYRTTASELLSIAAFSRVGNYLRTAALYLNHKQHIEEEVNLHSPEWPWSPRELERAIRSTSTMNI